MVINDGHEQGEFSALTNIVGAMEECLEKPEGCKVVPGLPENQYYFTLGTSIAGGLVLGFASKLEPGGRYPKIGTCAAHKN